MIHTNIIIYIKKLDTFWSLRLYGRGLHVLSSHKDWIWKVWCLFVLNEDSQKSFIIEDFHQIIGFVYPELYTVHHKIHEIFSIK